MAGERKGLRSWVARGSGFRGGGWLLVAVLVAAGCEGGADRASGDGGAADGAVDGGAEGSGYQPLRSGFVNVIAGSPFREDGAGLEGLFAHLADGPAVPTPHLVAAAGSCAVYAHPGPGFCDPACEAAACVDGECVAFAELVDAGVIEVEGLRAPLVFEPTEIGYQLSGEEPVGEPFVAGAEVVARAGGGESPGFTLRATAPAAIESHRDDLVALEPGEPATWTWDAMGGRVQLGLRRGWHGSPYSALVLCEVADDGTLTVPDEVIEAYVAENGGGTVDYWWLARFDRDVIEGVGGPIELFVASMDYHPQLL
jgi:hypothetical protein